MNIAVRYQSRNGNTRAVAEVIAKTAGVEAKPVSEPINEHADILFVGGGVYMWNADKELLDFLQGLDPEQVGQIAAFSTTGATDIVTKKICAYAKENGITANENTLCLKMLTQGHSALGLQGGKLTEKQIIGATRFAEKVTGDTK